MVSYNRHKFVISKLTVLQTSRFTHIDVSPRVSLNFQNLEHISNGNSWHLWLLHSTSQIKAFMTKRTEENLLSWMSRFNIEIHFTGHSWTVCRFLNGAIRIRMPTFLYRDRDSSVSITIRYELYGPAIESRWGRDFSHPFRVALGPTQPPIHGYRG
jgi:hypothetical protein